MPKLTRQQFRSCALFRPSESLLRRVAGRMGNRSNKPDQQKHQKAAMNIILVPTGIGKGRNISLGRNQALALAISLLVILPVLIGIAAFHVDALLAGPTDGYAARQARELVVQKREIADARRNAEVHLNALAQRLGLMQAQITRLDALGSRLTSMAGLDKREFNFSQEPPIGGPESDTAPSVSVPDFMQTLDSLEKQIDNGGPRLRALESLLMDRQLQAEVSPAGWPTRGGWISSGFGPRLDPFTGRPEFHEGVDIAAPMGTPIYAMAAGIVSFAGVDGGYGKMVQINDGDGLSTRYGHTSKILVKVGERVKKGQEIARVGSTGYSTGPHVHFEVLVHGHEINPLPYLHTASASSS